MAVGASSSNSPAFGDFATFSTSIQSHLLSLTRSAAAISDPSDLKFQRTLSRPLGKKVDAVSKRLLSVTQNVLLLADEVVDSSSKGKGKAKETFDELEEEDVVDAYQKKVVDRTDHLLEKIDINLDEYKRLLVKQKESLSNAMPVAGLGQGSTSAPKASTSRLAPELLNSTSTAKPQLLFNEPTDNSREATFVPLLPHKPNALTPLDKSVSTHTDETKGTQTRRTANPYYTEIQRALEQPLPDLSMEEIAGLDLGDQDASESEKMASRMNEKPFTLVDTVEKLQECLEKLKTAKIIAIDLEHHDFRSYRGFACLIQVCPSPCTLTGDMTNR